MYVYNGLTRMCQDCIDERDGEYAKANFSHLRMGVCDDCKHVTETWAVYQPYERPKEL